MNHRNLPAALRQSPCPACNPRRDAVPLSVPCWWSCRAPAAARSRRLQRRCPGATACRGHPSAEAPWGRTWAERSSPTSNEASAPQEVDVVVDMVERCRWTWTGGGDRLQVVDMVTGVASVTPGRWRVGSVEIQRVGCSHQWRWHMSVHQPMEIWSKVGASVAV